MVLGLMAGTFMGSAVSALSRFLISEFDLSRSRFGVLAAVFTLGGALSSPFIGKLADVIGGRRLLVLHFVACGIGFLAAAGAPTFGLLLAAVGALGIVSSSANPAANRVIMAAVAPRRRGAMMGLKATGQPLTVAVAGSALPGLASRWGWRVALGTGVLICAAGLVLSRWLPEDSPATQERNPAASGMSSPAIRWLTLNGAAMGAGASAVIAFLPLFGQERLSMSVTTGGALLAVMGFVSIGGRIAWGRLSDSVADVTTPMIWLALISLGVTAALAASPAVGPWLAWVAAAGAGLSMSAWNAVGMAAIVREVHPSVTGIASGVVMAGFLGGWMVTPFLFGLIVDATGSYVPAWSMVMAAFLVALIPVIRWRTSPRPTGPVEG